MMPFTDYQILRHILLLIFIKMAGGEDLGAYRTTAPASPTSKAQLNLVSFEAQILSRKRRDREDGITERAFQLYENNKERPIISVRQERKPLSLVLVVTLGVNGDCGYLEIEKYLLWLGEALSRNLKAEDEIAIAVTNSSGQLLLKFGETKDRLKQVFGVSQYGKGEIARVSNTDSKVVPGMAIVSSATASDPYRETQIRKNILMYSLNYLHIAVQSAIAYLNKERKQSSRPIIMFCNSLYNLAPVNEEIIDSIEQSLYKQGITVSWVGVPLPYLSRFFLPDYKNSNVEIEGKITKFYEQQHFWQNRDPWILFPEKMGGTVVDCDSFRPIIDEAKGREIFSKEIFLLIDNLRTRYKITYESDNSDLTQPRNIRLEMSPKWKGGKVTLHYPKIIYPQTPEK
jgi:hypothetical protein